MRAPQDGEQDGIGPSVSATMLSRRGPQEIRMYKGGVYNVQCVEDGTIYDSISAVARAYGVTVAAVSIAVSRGTRCCGMHWRFVNGAAGEARHRELRQAQVEAQAKRAQMQRVRVICVETQEVYESIKAAAAAAGTTQSSISLALSKRKKAGGVHWRRATIDHPTSIDSVEMLAAVYAFTRPGIPGVRLSGLRVRCFSQQIDLHHDGRDWVASTGQHVGRAPQVAEAINRVVALATR